MRDKKIYLLYPNCGYCVYYMIQYKVISKKYKKEAVFLGKVLEYSLFIFLYNSIKNPENVKIRLKISRIM